MHGCKCVRIGQDFRAGLRPLRVGLRGRSEGRSEVPEGRSEDRSEVPGSGRVGIWVQVWVR